MVTASKYRITGRELIQTIDNWEHLINFKVNLIGCGGTALTLLGIKDSTKDIDFIVPVGKEYERLMKFLRSLGYEEKGGGLAHPDDPFFCISFGSGTASSQPISSIPVGPGQKYTH
jgi:hypothetical protein